MSIEVKERSLESAIKNLLNMSDPYKYDLKINKKVFCSNEIFYSYNVWDNIIKYYHNVEFTKLNDDIYYIIKEVERKEENK